MCEQCRLTLCDRPQPMFRPPPTPLQPPVLTHCPPNQGEVEVSEDRIHSWPCVPGFGDARGFRRLGVTARHRAEEMLRAP